jgi:hypothetical protein
MPPNQVTIDCNAWAAGSSSGGTTLGTTAPRTAAPAPKSACCAATSTRRIGTERAPTAAWAQKSADTTAMPVCVVSRIRRRSSTSASAPPHSADTTSGTKAARSASPT